MTLAVSPLPSLSTSAKSFWTRALAFAFFAAYQSVAVGGHRRRTRGMKSAFALLSELAMSSLNAAGSMESLLAA